jgi:hypothetical protein
VKWLREGGEREGEVKHLVSTLVGSLKRLRRPLATYRRPSYGLNVQSEHNHVKRYDAKNTFLTRYSNDTLLGLQAQQLL